MSIKIVETNKGFKYNVIDGRKRIGTLGYYWFDWNEDGYNDFTYNTYEEAKRCLKNVLESEGCYCATIRKMV